MQHETKRTALITGASAGIGEAFAAVFAKNHFDLILTARREERLLALGKSLKDRYGTNSTIIPADLSDQAAPQMIYNHISAEGLTLDALVNNAGYGVPGFYNEQPWQKQADFIQVLVTAVAHLCHLALPGMIERGYGRIINVSSLNGLVPGSPGQTLYGSAKSFIVQLSQTLYTETKGTGVQVTAVCPGFTYSEFHDVTGTRDLVNKIPGYRWMDADTVALQGYEAVMAGEPLCINGKFNKAAVLLAKWLPHKMALRLVEKGSKEIRP